MRLIDADALIKVLETYKFGAISNDAEREYVKETVLQFVKEQPTAYDTEKVVAELETFANLSEDRWVNGTSNHAYQERKCWVKAIDIVKRGWY